MKILEIQFCQYIKAAAAARAGDPSSQDCQYNLRPRFDVMMADMTAQKNRNVGSVLEMLMPAKRI